MDNKIIENIKKVIADNEKEQEIERHHKAVNLFQSFESLLKFNMPKSVKDEGTKVIVRWEFDDIESTSENFFFEYYQCKDSCITEIFKLNLKDNGYNIDDIEFGNINDKYIELKILKDKLK